MDFATLRARLPIYLASRKLNRNAVQSVQERALRAARETEQDEAPFVHSRRFLAAGVSATAGALSARGLARAATQNEPPDCSSASVTALGAPFGVALSQAVADAHLLRSYGFIGDGGSHPLSSVKPTWPLTRWQQVYPHAQALADQIDWCAIQGIINATTPYAGLKINLPTCLANINRSIVTGTASVEFEGQGQDATRFLCSTSDMDLFQHGLSSQVYGATFTLKNLGLYVTGAGPRHAINIQQDPNSGGFYLERVRVASYSAAFSWLGFVYGIGTSHTIWKDCVMTGGEYNTAVTRRAGMTQVGVTFTSSQTSDRSFVYVFEDCQIGSIQNAFLFQVLGNTPNDHGSIEGVVFTRCGGRTVTGPWFRLFSPSAAVIGWYPPYYIWEELQHGRTGNTDCSRCH